MIKRRSDVGFENFIPNEINATFEIIGVFNKLLDRDILRKVSFYTQFFGAFSTGNYLKIIRNLKEEHAKSGIECNQRPILTKQIL